MRSAQGSPKPDGTERPLGIPTVLDRVIQQAIAQVLTPLWDGEFSENSYELDKELTRRGHVFARYADDFLILVKSAKAAQRVMESVATYVEAKLKLVVNRTKSKCAPLAECEFLGFKISKQGKVKWTEKSLKRCKLRVKEWERSGHRVSGGEPREG